MKRPTPELLDISRWPSVDVNALEDKARLRYQQRVAAVEHYATGTPLGGIESQTEIHRRVLYRMIERALQAHPDGQPWGFRALVPGLHIKAYERRKASKSAGVGLAGALSQLLERQPKLEKLVRQLIESRDIRLVQQGERVNLKNLRNAHNRFTAACRSLGLRSSDYPLNQEQQGLRSLGAALRQRMMQEFKEADRSAGGERIKPAAALAVRPTAHVRDPFDTVEFDAHRLDLRLKILDQDPYGEEQVLEIERAWLLALIDVGTRAILGYTLCLRREYSRYDVIRTFETALAPASMPTLTIPGLAPIVCGGFVSVALPETAHACWRRIRFDHARAHRAADSLQVACELLGCTVEVGPPYHPDERPFIERFFGTVATRFSHRLPGTTGSVPDDILRKLKDPHGDLRLVVSLQELRELLAVWVWNYNGTPHGGLGSVLRLTMKRHGNNGIDLKRLRATSERPARMAMVIPRELQINSVLTEHGLQFDVVTASASQPSTACLIVLYLHGGGYLFGSTKTHRQVLIATAKAFDAPVYGLDYRLAPEHPFPAAFNDAVLAYRWLLERHPNTSIVLVGDSAGAGLAIAAALAIRDKRLKPARGIVCFSAYSDLAVTGASVEANAKSCAMFTPRGVREAAALYLAGADARDPRASPLYGELSGLPPMLLFVSRHEILRDDTLRLAERASRVGVDVELIVRDRLPHVWPVFINLLPEARDAFVAVKSFAQRIGEANRVR